MQPPFVIGTCKRDLKDGDLITLRIRSDGLCESDDIKVRAGLTFLDLTLLKPQNTKENGDGNGQSCSIWK
jgi:hypothetical protein